MNEGYIHIIIFTHPTFLGCQNMPRYADMIERGMVERGIVERGHSVTVSTIQNLFANN